MRNDHKSKLSRKAAFTSFIGSALEWYDFYLYGIASALIFNKLFFPKFVPLTGIMAAYGTYAIGFFARPLGGVIFGHFGDRISRKKMLILTLSLMGVSTVLIGLLPTYNQIGIWAPIFLTILRFIQGLGVGGEWGGAIVLTAEHSRQAERGFYASWPNAGAPIGLILSIGIFLLFSLLPEQEMLTWGWRVPFVLGFILVILGLYIRLTVFESPIFEKQKNVAKLPIVELFRTSSKNFILAIGARFAESSSYYIFSVFVITYATYQLNISKTMILLAVMTASIIEAFSIPFFGHLSDRIGRRPVYLAGTIFIILFAFPYFWFLDSRSIPQIWYAIIVGLALGHGAMHGPQAAFFAEYFNTRIRYSGAAIAYHLSAAFSGGLAPLIATGLIVWSKGNPWPVSVYLIIMASITITSIVLSKETVNKHMV